MHTYIQMAIEPICTCSITIRALCTIKFYPYQRIIQKEISLIASINPIREKEPKRKEKKLSGRVFNITYISHQLIIHINNNTPLIDKNNNVSLNRVIMMATNLIEQQTQKKTIAN